ncbi:MAG: antitoxin family protein [Chloroflexota bacterium]|nr:antitoxin family protein [Chloroflexota bacterium]
MALPIHAIYEDGQLRLLDPVNLAQGQRVAVMIVPEINSVRDALSHMVVAQARVDENIDEDELMQLIEAELSAYPKTSLSEQVIQERLDGR